MPKRLELTNKRFGKLELATNQYYSNYRYQAKRRNLNFEITKEYFLKLVQQNCYYCNAEPRLIKPFYGEIVYFNGIDRKDNNKGYSVENCLPCCSTCNLAKKEMADSEFISWIFRVYNNIVRLR